MAPIGRGGRPVSGCGLQASLPRMMGRGVSCRRQARSNSLLDLAPKASAAREHVLKERIVAAALRQTEPRFAVVARSTKPARAGWRAWTGRASALRAPASSGWAAGGLLAASLVVGVLLGSAGTFDTAVQQVAEATGYSVTDTSSHLALGDEMVSASDEEVL